ncbi:excisionase [Citrobacter koseri]|nr:excisionase [Citrobacter koseri]
MWREVGMSDVILLTPNEWVTEKVLIAVTGLKPGTVLRARKESWMLGREYKHIAPDGSPKPTSECMYCIPEINRWIKSQPNPAVDL